MEKQTAPDDLLRMEVVATYFGPEAQEIGGIQGTQLSQS